MFLHPFLSISQVGITTNTQMAGQRWIGYTQSVNELKPGHTYSKQIH